jgi:hypothetical protein
MRLQVLHRRDALPEIDDKFQTTDGRGSRIRTCDPLVPDGERLPVYTAPNITSLIFSVSDSAGHATICPKFPHRMLPWCFRDAEWPKLFFA